MDYLWMLRSPKSNKSENIPCTGREVKLFTLKLCILIYMVRRVQKFVWFVSIKIARLFLIPVQKILSMYD